MKTLMLLAMLGVSGVVFAAEAPVEVAQHAPAAVQYDYSMKLDIAKVISLSPIPNVCEVVPAQMTYEDSAGERHVLQYQVMGDGCLKS